MRLIARLAAIKQAAWPKKVEPPDKRIQIKLVDGHSRAIVPDEVGVTVAGDGFISVTWPRQSSIKGRSKITITVEAQMEMVGKAECSECETTFSEWIEETAPKEEKIAARHKFNTTVPLCHGCRGLED